MLFERVTVLCAFLLIAGGIHGVDSANTTTTSTTTQSTTTKAPVVGLTRPSVAAGSSSSTQVSATQVTITSTAGVIVTCKEILAGNPNAPSQVYLLGVTLNEDLIQAYCEMGLNGGGYTFLTPDALSYLTDAQVQTMFTDRTTFLMRVRKCDGTQPYILLSQLDQNAWIPLKIGLNENTGYGNPLNAPILGAPYLYFGFLPIANAANNNIQGLKANGVSVTFSNCDKTANSQITLFANFKERAPSTYAYSTVWPMTAQLFGKALPVPSARVMPDSYFMFTELWWGGCGMYTQTDGRLACILSTAIGFR